MKGRIVWWVAGIGWAAVCAATHGRHDFFFIYSGLISAGCFIAYAGNLISDAITEARP